MIVRLPASAVLFALALLPVTPVAAKVVLGAGASPGDFLVGGDLTDPEDDGDENAGTGFAATFSASHEANFEGSEGAFNVFDNSVGTGNAKFCCHTPTTAAPFWVEADFASAVTIRSFTLTSGNDTVPGRDPDLWEIQGTNGSGSGATWTTIFSYDEPGVSPFTATNQTVLFQDGDDFPIQTTAYTRIRYLVESTQAGGIHQLNEIELFDVDQRTWWYVATDGDDTNTCATASDPCATVAAAIGKAAAGDAIAIAAGTYSIAAEIAVSKDLRLRGASAATTVLQGTGASRILTLSASVDAVFENLTIRDGVATTGGGIHLPSTATLTIRDSRVWNNQSTGDSTTGGGGVYSNGILDVERCWFEDNTAPNGGRGGGIYSDSSSKLYVSDSLFVDNDLTPAASGNQEGGAILLRGGGGVTVEGFIERSTFVGNDAEYGGALCVRNTNNAVATVIDSTFSGNSSTAGGDAVLAFSTGNVITVTNSLFAAHPGSQSTCDALNGSVVSGGWNLSDDADCAAFFTQASDQNSADADLGTLADNGGPLQTLLPGGSSDARDTGNCTETSDARGFTRPVDLVSAANGATGNACDVGAVEVQLVAAPSGLQVTGTTGTTVDLSWTDNSSEAVTFELTRTPGSSVDVGSLTSYQDATVACDTDYTYTVRAVRTSDGEPSASSNAVDVTTAATCALAAPSDLTVIDVGTTFVELQWTDNTSDETSFEVTRTPGGTTSLPAGTTAYRDEAAACNTSYEYAVRAKRSGDGAQSNRSTVMATTDGCTWYVATDGDDGNSCSEPEAACLTLAGAVAKAADLDLVSIAAGTYTVTTPTSVDRDLTISGAGGAATILSGGDTSRVLEISGSTVTLEDLTISDGYASTGGGLWVSSTGTATIRDVRVWDNIATSARTGGIDGGAGILNQGALTVERSWFERNDTTNGGRGGGIFHRGSNLIVRDSLFVDNDLADQAGDQEGGALLLRDPFTVESSTFVGNGADYGGAISVRDSTAIGTVTDSTLWFSYGGLGGDAIDVYNAAVVTIANSLFAGSSGGGSCGVSGATLTSAGHNLSDDASCAPQFTASGDLNETDAGLTLLRFNGGPLETAVPGPSSAARDGGSCTDTTDARGLSRPVDLAGSPNAATGNGCDIGAVEVHPLLAPIDLQVTSFDSDSVSLGWTDSNTDATGYELVRTPGATISDPSTSYEDATVACATTYQYLVRAVRADEVSADSNVVEVTTGPCAVTVSPTSGLVTDEAGGSDSFTVVLTVEPTAAVVVEVVSGDTGEITVSPSQLTFTPTGTTAWNLPQTVTLTGVDDPIDDGDQAVTITLETNDALTLDDAFDAEDPADVAATNVDGESGLYTLTPCRLFDSREAAQGPALGSGESRVLQVHGSCGVPANARAIAFNVTVVEGTGLGHLLVFPSDQSPPAVSSINFAAGQVRANNGVVQLATDGSGTVSFRPFVAGGGSVHVILDVAGYFE
jgi:hypothetical protein